MIYVDWKLGREPLPVLTVEIARCDLEHRPWCRQANRPVASALNLPEAAVQSDNLKAWRPRGELQHIYAGAGLMRALVNIDEPEVRSSRPLRCRQSKAQMIGMRLTRSCQRPGVTSRAMMSISTRKARSPTGRCDSKC